MHSHVLTRRTSPLRRADIDCITVLTPTGAHVRTWKALFATAICFDGARRVFVRCVAPVPGRGTAQGCPAAPCVNMFTDGGDLLASFSLSALVGGIVGRGLAIDARGRMYVGDAENDRVLVFELS